MTDTIDIVRNALLITLPILLVAVLYKRFKQRTIARDLPAAAHVELVGLEVAYHPTRLRALVKVPAAHAVGTAILDGAHVPLQHWPEQRMEAGEHWIERAVEQRADGTYFFQLSTATQRTVRQFRLQQA